MSHESPYLGQGCSASGSRSERLRRELWAFVQATVFRWSPRSWHGFRARLLRSFGANIPAPGQVVIFPTVRITYPWRLTLAPRTMVGPRVTLYNIAPIALERGANISQNCHLCAGSHDYRHWSMPLIAAPIVIGSNVWLGADVFVGPGVAIGELCVVGARSVVVRHLPPRMLCVGHPCQPIRDRPDPV